MLILSNAENNNGSYAEKYQAHIPFSFAYKVVCIISMINLFFTERKMLLINLLKQFLKNMVIAKI